MEMVSINPIIGNTITPEPMFETISKNPVVVPLSFVTQNFGRSKSGKPDGILPVKNVINKEISNHITRVIVDNSRFEFRDIMSYTYRPL